MKVYTPADAAFSVKHSFFAENTQKMTGNVSRKDPCRKSEEKKFIISMTVLSWGIFLAGAALIIVRNYYPGII